MYAAIQEKLNAIRALPVCGLHKRQLLLVDLLVSLVNSETNSGNDVDNVVPLERHDWWATLSSLTADAGFTRLGEGHFSAAYSHAMLPGRVIKVGFKKEDSGAAYVAFCRMHQGRAGIPVIHDVQRHTSCYTVVMDKLSPLGDYGALERNGVEPLWTFIPYAVWSKDGQWERTKKENAGLYATLSAHELETLETCRMIYRFFTGIATFDMHLGNAMIDHKGQIVITDPVSYTVDDSPITKCDATDLEALLVEIELAATQALIGKCKRRKALRDPNGAPRIQKRLANRNKRRWRNRHEEKPGIDQPLKVDINPIGVDKWRIAQGMPLLVDDILQARLQG